MEERAEERRGQTPRCWGQGFLEEEEEADWPLEDMGFPRVEMGQERPQGKVYLKQVCRLRGQGHLVGGSAGEVLGKRLERVRP